MTTIDKGGVSGELRSVLHCPLSRSLYDHVREMEPSRFNAVNRARLLILQSDGHQDPWPFLAGALQLLRSVRRDLDWERDLREARTKTRRENLARERRARLAGRAS